MSDLLQRNTLVLQLVELLRKHFQEGRWTGRLPGEYALCDQLQVSRGTLRAALKILRREGWIEVAKGRHTRVRTPPRSVAGTAKTGVVRLLVPRPMVETPPFQVFWMADLRRYLQQGNYRLETHHDLLSFRRRPFRALEKLVAANPADCWIVQSAPVETQDWFQRRQIPTVLAGTCHQGIDLPFLDLDYRAVCRHAAGVFLGMGHRRVAFLYPKEAYAGDLASEQGFREGFRNHRDGEPIAIRHEMTVEGIHKVLHELLQSENRPTGILVSQPNLFFAVIVGLMNSGWRVPHDISLICRDDAPFMLHSIPSVARYVAKPELYARRMARIALQFAAAGTTTTRQNWIVPRYQAGQTMAHRHG